jgi:hypothetical protein
VTAPARRRRWSDVLLRPQVLVAVLLAGSGVPWLLGGLSGGAPPRPPGPLLVGEPLAAATRADVPIVVIDRDGLRRTLLVTVETLDVFDARLAGALRALREVLVEEGNWPVGVPAPTAQSYESQRRRVVVIDVRSLGSAPGVALTAELAALRSLQETAFAHGADDVRVVVDGSPAATLWGQIALR